MASSPKRLLGDRLVARRSHLECRRQVHPQLDGLEQPALLVELLGRELLVLDVPTGGHPLGLAFADVQAGDQQAGPPAVLGVQRLAVEALGDPGLAVHERRAGWSCTRRSCGR